MDLSWQTITIATTAVYISETYAVIIGGGGSFLLQPILIMIGIPPAIAVAHDVTSSLGTSMGGATLLHSKRLIRWHLIWWWLPGVILGAPVGVYILHSIPSYWIENSIGLLALISVLHITFLKRESGIVRSLLPENWKLLAFLFGILVGVYMGFSGAGTGLFLGMLLISFFGTTIIDSMGIKKIVLGIATLTSIISYIYFDLLDWRLSLAMMGGAFLAGLTGSHIALKIGNLWLKRIFIVVVSGLAIWLLLK